MGREQHLLPPRERAARVAEKQALILQFLRAEIWSTPQNLGTLLGVKASATYRTLGDLSRQRLIRTARVPILGGHASVWGITTHGQAMAAPEGDVIKEKVFEPGRVSARYFQHIVDIQWLRIVAERQGWTQWVNADRIDKWAKDTPRPDAFAINLQGLRVAIECERTIKTPSRYVEILSNWLQAIRRNEVDHVIWICPDERMRNRLQSIVTGITHLEIAGQKILIPRERFELLDFLTYSDWSSL